MEQLTAIPVNFGDCSTGHLYKASYANNRIAIVAGEGREIGVLSVNLDGCEDVPEELAENEFFVKLYGTGETMNKPCLETGLFKVEGKPFKVNHGMFQKWSLNI